MQWESSLIDPVLPQEEIQTNLNLYWIILSILNCSLWGSSLVDPVLHHLLLIQYYRTKPSTQRKRPCLVELNLYHSNLVPRLFCLVLWCHGITLLTRDWGETINSYRQLHTYKKSTSCYRSANKLLQICSQAGDKLCSHCLFLVVVTSLAQAVYNLLQGWCHYQTCYKVVLTSLIQSRYNKNVTRLTRVHIA